jgi:hypothetical protein
MNTYEIAVKNIPGYRLNLFTSADYSFIVINAKSEANALQAFKKMNDERPVIAVRLYKTATYND